ncbi:MAG: GGDEF domain-containing protein [Henriciella sp.]|nr:GGDEF domain-containing protein [Henriciella sp.]
MADYSRAERIKSERDYLHASVRTGAIITLGATAIALCVTWLTTRHLGPEIYVQALLTALLLPMVIAPLCFVFTVRQGLLSHRQMLEINQLAHTDEMTGLPNRRAFMREAASRFSNADLSEDGICILLIDLDHFKSVNDQFGHDVGDKTLIHVAREIDMTAPVGSFVARLGGEEFAVLLSVNSRAELHQYGERMRARVASQPCIHEGIGIRVTISIGAGVAAEGDSVSGVLTQADRALYEAKNQGRNRFSMAA